MNKKIKSKILERGGEVYDFDDILIVPSSTVTIDPQDIELDFQLAGHKFRIPFIASAMDGIVDVNFAIKMAKLGGLAVLNLHGIQTRYANPDKIYEKIISEKDKSIIYLLQKIYSVPIRKELIYKRIKEIKKHGSICAVSSIPADAEEFGVISQEAGADIFFVQSTVTSYSYKSSRGKELSIEKLCKTLKIPVVVGNCVTYEVAYKLMSTGIKGIVVGIGPGAACTTRYTLGIGMPQVSATVNVACARDEHYKKTGEYIPVIIDGGIRRSDDIGKVFALGADAVMIGSLFAGAKESPAKGYNWGMASSHPSLPRGKRIRIELKGPLKEILYGPSRTDDGSMNFVGALKNAIGICGARSIKEFRKTQLALLRRN